MLPCVAAVCIFCLLFQLFGVSNEFIDFFIPSDRTQEPPRSNAQLCTRTCTGLMHSFAGAQAFQFTGYAVVSRNQKQKILLN